MSGGERIAKRLARAGVASRRGAEKLIAEGRVAVDGKVLDSPAFNVAENALVTLDGAPIPEIEPTRLFRYHKPTGLVVSAADEKGRETIFDHLPKTLPRLVAVGRLDLTSEGLLLLTNDGELARHLELPETGWARRYRVRVYGHPKDADFERLKRGIAIDGMRYGRIDARLDRQQGDNAWLSFALREGKNREVRRVCEFFGWRVSRLIRTAYGPFQLGNLGAGEVEEVPRKVLKEQLGAFAGEAPEPKLKPKSRTKPKSGPGRGRDRR